MSAVQLMALVLVAGTGTGAVLTRGLREQAIAMASFGGSLALVFVLFEAPGVALSQLVVSAVLVPLVLLLTVSKVADRPQADGSGEQG